VQYSWGISGLIPSEVEILLFQSAGASTEDHHTYCSVDNGALSMWVKWLGQEADRLHLSCAKINSTCRFTFIPPCIFMAWCLVNHKDSNILIFTSYPYLDPQKIFSHYGFVTKILHNILFPWHMLHVHLPHMYWLLLWCVSLLMSLWKTVDCVPLL
jgi:hypothetical protein